MALFTALMAVGTYIRIPIGPVPVVLTTLFILAAGVVLGAAAGTVSVLFYLLLGALGLPVFSAGGGLALFAGPTGGFLVSYPFMALLAGLMIHHRPVSRLRDAGGLLLGTFVIYLPGIPWLKYVLGLDWPRAFAAGLLPFIPGDLIKILILLLVLPRLRKAAPEFFYPPEQDAAAGGKDGSGGDGPAGGDGNPDGDPA